MGGVYQFSKDCSSNLREKDDALNSALGGFMAGTMMGLRCMSIFHVFPYSSILIMWDTVRSLPGVFGYGTALAAILGAFSFTGGKLSGSKRDRDHDEVARKMEMRKNRRRPLEETVNELGEGRGKICPSPCFLSQSISRCCIMATVLTYARESVGVYAPGYEERRAQRIKEAYNIDVPPSSSRMAS
nr:nadh-ubiquinone oxidoreductase 21.3 kda subunit [Quercus suber]